MAIFTMLIKFVIFSSKDCAALALSSSVFFSAILSVIAFLSWVVSILSSLGLPSISIVALPSLNSAVLAINSLVSSSTPKTWVFILPNLKAFLPASNKSSYSSPVCWATSLSLCISIAVVSILPSLAKDIDSFAAFAISSVRPLTSLRAIYISLNGSASLDQAPPRTCNCADISIAGSKSNNLSAIPAAKFISTPNLVTVLAISASPLAPSLKRYLLSILILPDMFLITLVALRPILLELLRVSSTKLAVFSADKPWESNSAAICAAPSTPNCVAWAMAETVLRAFSFIITFLPIASE